MRQPSHIWVRPLTVAIDVVVVNLAILMAFWGRFLGHPPAYNWDAYLALFPWLSLSVVVLLASYGLYEERWLPVNDLRQRLAPVVGLLAALTIVISFLLGTRGFPRSVFVISAVFQFPLLYLWRRALIRWRYERRSAHVVLVSHLPDARMPNGIEEVGFRPRISVQDPESAMTAEAVDIYLVDDSLNAEEKGRIFLAALERNIPCLWQPSIYDGLISQAELMVYGSAPYLSLRPVQIPWIHTAGKRLVDIVLAAVLLVISLPLDLVIAAAILLDDGAPVWYTQERVSIQNRRFRLWKFRSLERDFEHTRGIGLTLPGSPGVTRVGRWLRASHLDEIPQLWNVLKGDMSLVGPRPERPLLVEEFTHSLPSYALRHQMKPGLTGLAQVSGHYLSTPEEKWHMDLSYGRRHNFWHDLRIMLLTVLHLWKKPPRQHPPDQAG